jgi:murein DD-endopeptidase MepM/ murein hydrolase activator NlpD
LYVRIFHPAFGLHTFMAHMNTISVHAGQQVKQGQKIGTLGSTGNSSGPHVHFEIRLGTRDAYAQGTFGCGNGRVDPETVMYFFAN